MPAKVEQGKTRTGESALTELRECLANASCVTKGASQVAPTPRTQQTTEPEPKEGGKRMDGSERKHDGGGSGHKISLRPHGSKTAEIRRTRGGRHGNTADKSFERETDPHHAVARPIPDKATSPSPRGIRSTTEGVDKQSNEEKGVKQGSGPADKVTFGREGIGGGRITSGEAWLTNTTRPEAATRGW